MQHQDQDQEDQEFAPLDVLALRAARKKVETLCICPRNNEVYS